MVASEVRKLAELVQEITAASREQNVGTEQINRAIAEPKRLDHMETIAPRTALLHEVKFRETIGGQGAGKLLTATWEQHVEAAKKVEVAHVAVARLDKQEVAATEIALKEGNGSGQAGQASLDQDSLDSEFKEY